MTPYAIDNYLLGLIREEVHRAAKEAPGFASVKARRDYGLSLIRQLPTDIDWRALEASFLGVRSVAPDVNLEPKPMIARLEKQWRKEHSPFQMQAGGNAKGLGR